MNALGVMQGRLLPKYKGRFQAHPIGTWQTEFGKAREMNLDLIEFIFDFNDANQNPLLTETGRASIKDISLETGVMVQTICADYFMECPLHSPNDLMSDNAHETLIKLFDSASKIGVTDIVLPCVDQSSISSQCAFDRFLGTMKNLVQELNQFSTNLCLETDLSPVDFSKLIDSIGCDRIMVNYDIGNSASLGFDPAEEFAAYGCRITDIHIKDRTLGGGSVHLGSGDAQFAKLIGLIEKYDYRGPLIFQTYRDDNPIQTFVRQKAFFLRFLIGDSSDE